MHAARLFRMLIPAQHRRRGSRARDLLPGDGGDRQRRRQRGLVPGPELRRVDGGRLSRPESCARNVRRRRDAAVATGAPSPGAKAIVTDGGYRVTGHWQFASGSRHSQWLGGHATVCEPDGSAAARAERQAARTAHDVLPEVEGEDHRHLAGDRAARHRQRRLRGQRPVRAGGLQLHPRIRRRPARDRAALPVLDLQHVRHGVLRGRARHRAHACSTDFIALAKGKTPHSQIKLLAENNFIQINIGLSEARLGAARAYVLDYYAQLYEQAPPARSSPMRSASPAAA